MMWESRDPAIKLFGKTIALPLASDEGSSGDDDKGSQSPNKEINNTPERKDIALESPNAQGKNETEQAVTCGAADETEKPNSSDDQETAAEQQQQSDSGEKPALKKPDKIIPCPRCNSMDTKFCYYNNYNVNQPRHFCKNCQRYWTAGGTMRNVPVGAGRRKNKNSAAVNHYRHLTMTDAAAAALQAIPDQIHHPALKPNGTVLSFGPSEAPLCESMASVLSIAEKAIKNCNRNGFHMIEERIEEQPTNSSSAASATNPSVACRDDANGANLQETGARNCQGFAPHHLPYINGSPWPYPWSPTLQPPPGAAPAQAFCASSFPIPIYPAAAYWGCGAWSIPWVAPLASPPTASGGGSSGSGPNSPTLGKHSRDGNVLTKNSSSSCSNSDKGDTPGLNQSNQQQQQEKCLWIPKTLRIDDPEAAAKSSIWATMGFKNEKSEGMFRSFQNKGELSINHKLEASQLLHANPAAMSRSFNFQEST